MLKGILGAVLANYQLCAFKEHYQHKDLQLCAHRHTIPSHPLSPLFPTSALSPPKLSPFLLPVVVLPFSAPYDSHDPPCLISLLRLSSLFSFPVVRLSIPVLPIPKLSSLSAPLFPLLLSMSSNPPSLLPPPPPPPPTGSSSSSPAQNRRLNNEPGVSQTARELH